MRKFALLLLLAGLSADAAAAWTLVNRGEEVNAYADPESIRASGNFVSMLDLMDFRTGLHAANQPFLSRRDEVEYDCNEERYRSLVLSVYSGNMGAGEELYTEALPGKWTPVTPGSVAAVMYKIACQK
jgi:hypothetical protein